MVHDVERPVFGFLHNHLDVFSDDTDRQKLYASQEDARQKERDERIDRRDGDDVPREVADEKRE